ncbi:MAG TPA: hypothetical protein VM535_01245 [Candidatus Saccharimonadales bacterium]|nr:hypothetical protein [Candidatus Saccharimonadales bacterium]
MIKRNQVGAVNGLAISLVFAVLLLIGAIAFGVWAYGERQDYKNNTDGKIADAVTIAKQQESSLKDKQFQEAEKNPLKTYNGPQAYGSIVLAYPKTWSGYVADNGNGDSNGDNLMDGYFYPGVVPSVDNEGSVFALRLQVLDEPYAEAIKDIASLQHSKAPPKVTPYALPKVPQTVGVRVSGTLPNDKSGNMVVLPLRDQTFEIWTEGSQFTGDFDNIILPNLTFSP